MHEQNGPEGGTNRDASDWERVRHGRERHVGFPLGQYRQPAPMLFTRDGHNVFLGDMYRGRSAFLLCGGPSLATHDLSKLSRRGVLTCALNNAAVMHRPHLWVSVDDPGNFCDAIWRDPGVMKFVPLCHMEKKFTVRNERNELVESTEVVGDMPAVFSFRRNERFLAEQWLTEDTFNWGNHGDLVDAHGVKGSRSVMLPAVRLLFFLGVRALYLLGCDFRMTLGEKNYAFEQDRSRGSVNGNNQTYEALNVRFKALLPYFAREGFEVFNCTPNSGLVAFPAMDFDAAVERATSQMPRQMVTAGMYDRKQRTKEGGRAKGQAAPVASSPQVRSVAPTTPVEQPRKAADAVASLPELTLITWVDARTACRFAENWPLWTARRPELKDVRKLVLAAEGEKLDARAAERLKGDSSVELLRVAAGPASEGRNRWTRALFDAVADAVSTPWYVKFEPEATATEPAPLWQPDWLSPDEQGRIVRFVSSPWGYTKPADALERLDEWGDGAKGLREFPRLHVPFDPTSDRVRHDAISSWLFFASSEWTREVASYFASRPPLFSHDTLVWYFARRRGDGYRRVSLKRCGWDHSFAKPCRGCRKNRAAALT